MRMTPGSLNFRQIRQVLVTPPLVTAPRGGGASLLPLREEPLASSGSRWILFLLGDPAIGQDR